ncbi:MAG: ABC transporter permease [Eubacteriales bacterium]|nr:ABC transporter permease [Eubacteriales bacterium]
MADQLGKKRQVKDAVRENLREYIVTYVFLALSVLFVILSGRTLQDIFSQLMGRLTRNLFIVLSLIIPIIAGMGINFAITIGAMAAQVGLMLAINWDLQGFTGLLAAAGITLPLAAFFGFLIGSLLNKMKGQETIGSLILGYFANGAYQLLFLFIFGKVIPLSSKVTIVGASGVANTLNLMGGGLYMALDKIWQVPFDVCLYVVSGVILAASITLFLLKKMSRKRFIILASVSVIFSALVAFVPAVGTMVGTTTVPIFVFLLVGLLCLFNVVIMRTRLGQKFRAVGQSRTVANAAGINVNRVRVIAIMISTVLAGWGQIIFIQNLGTLQTYSAHEMVGLYAGASILVGGASLNRATNTQAIVGTLLFHLLFVVSQDAGKTLFGNANVGEFFRVFVAYGVIAVALVMHTWRANMARAKKSTLQA